MGSFDVHKVNFFSPELLSVKCMSIESDTNKLAIGRSNASIEVWDVSYKPHIDRILMCDSSIDGLEWHKGRLFSCSANGTVTEHDLQSLSPMYYKTVTSGSCWCIAIHKNSERLAAGTQDGYINIFEITPDGLTYDRLMDKQEGRISCISWDITGEWLVTGSVNALRIYSRRNGHAVHKLPTGQSETVVSSLVVANDFTIISADSRGKLCFWDGYKGINIANHQALKTNALTLCLDESQAKVYCSGVDPTIVCYEKITMKSDSNIDCGKWVRSVNLSAHRVEVKSLIHFKGKLYSGGIDGYLAVSSYPPKLLVKYPPLMPSSVSLATDARYVMLKYLSHLDIWHLGDKHKYENKLSKLVTIKYSKNDFIRCATISPDGTWIVYSTEEKLKIFSLIMDIVTSEPMIKKTDIQPVECDVSTQLAFSSDSKYLWFATKHENTLVCLEMSHKFDLLTKYCIDTSPYIKDLVHLLEVSKSNKYIVIGDRLNNIIVFSEGLHYCTLPKYHCPPTSLKIHPTTENLVIAYADRNVFEYNINKKEYTQFSENLLLTPPSDLLNRPFPINFIAFDESRSDAVILSDDNTICVVTNDNKSTPDKSTSKIKKRESENKKISVKILQNYEHLVFFDFLNNEELVAIEVNPCTLVEKLPFVYKKKIFGMS
ncbi:U3 small nucleolar RNA-associated protein 4 homolog isoform X2 [Daktulosphaira vitifoliae]|nr:U3 small nucleolar RNA-associated protein 4 homolog isoform X2 [Daktulosphaira vitifoliae]XP_050534509.1 U3 small nucleolar RNA-associated protein 4 homolog isoform X2 [Daktulosphaira vitifoliae]